MFQRDLSFVHKYFMAEKQESLLFIIIGVVAFLLSGMFFFFVKSNPSFFKGAAIPLMVIGLILGIVGYTVYARSNKQRLDVAYNIGIEPSMFINNQELPRMRTVMKNFIIYRYTEIALAVAGLILFFYFRTNTDRQFWAGLGMTLTIMALTALFADYFAEQRGSLYIKGLENFTSAK